MADQQQFERIFNATLAALENVRMPQGIPETITVDTGSTSTGINIERTANEILIEQLERFLLAIDLAGTLRNLSQVLNTSVIQLAIDLGVPLRELTEILGVELNNLSMATAAGLSDVALLLGADVLELMDVLEIGLHELVIASGLNLDNLSQSLVEELGDFANTLGVNVLELITALDISIADLGETFGINIGQFSAEQFRVLVAFSNSLGAEIADVARELRINLGRIADTTSILSEALALAISELPDAIQADLGPLLEAIRIANEGADASVAIQDLGNFILELPPQFSKSLIPFLDLIGFQRFPPELGVLLGIEQNTADTVAAIHELIDSMSAGDLPLAGSDPKLPDPVFDPLPTPDPGPIAILEPVFDPVFDPLPTPDPGPIAILEPVIQPLPLPLPEPIPGLTPVGKQPIYKIDIIEQFAKGGSVDQTGLYQLHAGEFVVTRSTDNLNVATNTGDQMSSNELSEIRSVLVAIREQDRRYQDSNLEANRGMESSLKEQNEQARRIANA